MSAIQQALMAGGAASGSSDPYFSNVISLLHFEDGAGSTTFADQKGVAWTPAGNAAVGTIALEGSGALGLDGSGDLIYTDDFTSLSASAWTIEFAVQSSGSISSVSPQNYKLLVAISNGVIFPVFLGFAKNTPGAPNTVNTYLRLFLSSNGTTYNIANAVYGSALPGNIAGIYYRIAIVFTGTHYKVFVDGVEHISVASTSAIAAFSRIHVGGQPGTASQCLVGYMDEWRVTNGVARYTGAYTPTTDPFPDS